MTVAELIEKLKELPQDARMFTRDHDGYATPVRTVEESPRDKGTYIFNGVWKG